MTADPAAAYRALRSRINTDTETLLKRFENILSLAPLTLERRDADGRVVATERKDKNIAAAEALQVEVHAQSMILAAEDLLALTKMLKEAWVFGQLPEDGGDEGAKRVEEDAKVVGERLREWTTKERACEN